MTLPTLINNYQKKQTAIRLKKAYSAITQVVQLSEAEYGSLDSWDINSMPGDTDADKKVYFTENYFIKRLNVAKKCTLETRSECISSAVAYQTAYGGAIITNDGYGMFFHVGGVGTSAYSQHIHIAVDINGPKKGDNSWGKDIFRITVNLGPQHVVPGTVPELPKKSGVYMAGLGYIPALSRDELINSAAYGCNKNLITVEARAFCGALIMLDDWEIKDDYPW